MIRPDTDSPKEGERVAILPLSGSNMEIGLAAIEPPTAFLDNVLPMLAVVGIIGIGVLWTISIRGKIARRNANRPSPRELIDQLKETARHRVDGQSASAELLDAARQMAAKLDNKAARLEVLIQQADDRIALMSQDNGSGVVTQNETQLTAPTAAVAVNGGTGVSIDPLTQSVYELADTGCQPIQIAQALDEQVGKVELILSLRDR